MTVEGVTYTVAGLTGTITKRGLHRDFEFAELVRFERHLLRWHDMPIPLKPPKDHEDAVERVYAIFCSLGTPVPGSQLDRARTEERKAQRQVIAEEAVVRVLVKENPMRKGKRSFDQFQIIMDLAGAKVQEIVKEFQRQHPDWPANLAINTIKWCMEKQYIEVD